MADIDADVDDLLNASVEMSTGTYDVSFFKGQDKDHIAAADHLACAKSGLSLFLEEAIEALKSNELTVDQRIHVATIVSYVEALSTRFDVICVPGFKQKISRRR